LTHVEEDPGRARVPIEASQASPELIDFYRKHISSVKCPRSADFDAGLPRHPTGKLYKRLRKDRYWGNKDSRIA
jgi:acyl-coenzyme A synthetase/AMP-(fatty) acid ligase